MKTKLKIAVAARDLTIHHTGPAEYLRGFTSELVRLNNSHEIIIYYNSSSVIGTFPYGQEKSLEIKNRFIWDHIALPLALKRDNVDVVFFPKSTQSLILPCKACVIALDLGYFYPQLNAYKTFESIYMRSLMRYTGKKAWSFFTLSDNTSRDVVRFLNAPPEKVMTIYGDCMPQYSPINDTELLNKIKEKYDLKGPFIFFPTSTISPRKNFTRVLDALEKVQDIIPHHLYFTGGLDWKSKAIIERLEGPLSDRVHRLGVVPAEDMPVIYSLAQFVIYPSLFEGLGIPVLEAFHCGVPVLTSSRSSLPEVAGDAALIVDPYSCDQIAKGIVRLASDKKLRKTLIQKGYQQAQKFSWKKSVSIALNWIEENW
jgi:glycosyltransferase involved in cell wall biosynthesis